MYHGLMTNMHIVIVGASVFSLFHHRATTTMFRSISNLPQALLNVNSHSGTRLRTGYDDWVERYPTAAAPHLCLSSWRVIFLTFTLILSNRSVMMLQKFSAWNPVTVGRILQTIIVRNFKTNFNGETFVCRG
jgi:hypothetical protein